MKKFMILTLVVCSGMISAKEWRPSTDRAFDNAVARTELAIVLFYQEMKENKDQARRLREDFSSASRGQPYVTFVLVNTAKERLTDVAQDFNVTKMPTLMLFKDGVPYKKGGAVATMTGFVHRGEMMRFIRDNFKDFIEVIRKERREEARERAERRANFGFYYGYPYPWGWGYPYYGPGWGWGPGFYIGF